MTVVGDNALNAQQIAVALFDLEQTMDMDAPCWIKGGVHLWPLYRMELTRLFFKYGAQTEAAAGTNAALRSAFKRTRSFGSGADQASPIWLVSDGVSFSTIGDREIERFCEPVYHALQAASVQAVIIDRGSPTPRNTMTPTRWWAPTTMRAKIFGTVNAFIRPDRRHDEIAQLIKEAASRLSLNLPSFNPRRFNAMTNATFALASLLTKKMQQEAVKCLFIVSYYDTAGYAYVLAAQRAKALVVDIQHGVIGKLNPAYAKWAIDLNQDASFIPDRFLCWMQSDVDNINRWAHVGGSEASGRSAILAGHPFVEAWRQGSIKLSDNEQADMQELLTQSKDKPAVLISLQPDLSSREALAPLLELWRSAPDVAWWIRLHPLALEDHSAVQRLIDEYSVPVSNIDLVSHLPLPALLAHCNMHMTHSSSVTLEAELMSVPSIIWSTYGQQLFEEQVRRQSAFAIKEDDAIGSKFTELLSASRDKQFAQSPNQLKRAVMTILEELK